MGKKTEKKSENKKNKRGRTAGDGQKSKKSSIGKQAYSDKEYGRSSRGNGGYQSRGYDYGNNGNRDYRYSENRDYGYRDSGFRESGYRDSGYSGYYERNDKYRKSYSYDNRGAGKQYSYGNYSYEGYAYGKRQNNFSSDEKFEGRNRKKSSAKTGSDNAKKRKNTGEKKNSQNRSGANAGKRDNKKNNTAKNGKKKPAVKKRFYVFVAVFILLLAALVAFSIKTAVNLVMIYSDKQDTQNKKVTTEQAKDPAGSSGDEKQNKADNTDSADGGTVTLEDEYGNSPAVMTTDPVSDSVDEQGNPVYNNLSQEQQIRTAILSSWYMYPLGQQRSVVEIVFGKLIRYENWNERIYYHRGFPDTMYVTYDEQLGDDGLPMSTSICTGVNIALEKIIGFESFTPGSDVWGKVHKDESGKGWTDYYYYVLIRDNLTMKVYCDKNGAVQQSSHVKVNHL